MFDIIILGGGASALMCASVLSLSNKKVAIIEKDDRVGKKILVTGNGRCNLSNKNIDSSKYNNENVMKFFDKFSERETISFFNKIGIEVYSDEEGRIYPITNIASSVCDCLRKSLKDNVQIFTSQNATLIKKENDIYLVKTNVKQFETKNLVVACGGGTQNLLNNFDISYSQNYSSLLPLKCDKSFVKNLNGIRINAKIKLIVENPFNKTIKEMEENGELLFKDNGISGICVFNLSSLLAREKTDKGTIYIDLLPNFTYQQLVENLQYRVKNLNYLKGTDILLGLFHKNIAMLLFEKLNITELRIENVDELVKLIKSYKIEINGVLPNGQVYSGGVPLSELDENLESKKYKGLFFIGEVVDVDGVCGGYNLQWAWTSGHIVGEKLCID